MIVITADQVDSRSTPDVASATLERLNRMFGEHLELAADRTAGDEIQMLVDGGRAAIDVVLDLTRTGRWSVGMGFGPVREPLGASIRESTGDAFVAARSAVERAKKKQTRFAAATEPVQTGSRDLEALVDLLLILRARRSDQGWEIHDLVARGLSQADAATEMGITPQSASKRARAADLKAENAAIAPLARLADALDAAPATEEKR
ncbi:hypothetical protein GCM10027413_26620 [Conyzicola nivalis]|uniref:DNA-binding protein n=1 Tax=Conyzicola nivalis TaxID=1477021 RepID=A0A916WNM7_9MICO|nr:DNA-binding protein [Conyzicola nivalis]GGB15701.1 hypothetical protein GCM10010979_32890 [Conyzicola nivalis]